MQKAKKRAECYTGLPLLRPKGSPTTLSIQHLNNKLKRANHYALRTILNLGNLATYCLSITSLNSLGQRRIDQSLMVFQSFGLHGPPAWPLSKFLGFFIPRVKY